MKNSTISSKWAFHLAAMMSLGASVQAAELEVTVSGATPGTGTVVLSLFDSEDNYLTSPLIEMTQPVDNTGQVTFSLEALEARRYAIAVFDDADKNGKLNTGLFGIPAEKVGFSNNPRARFGPPGFEKASFTLPINSGIYIHLGKAKK